MNRKTIFLIQNANFEGPGLISEWAKARGYPLEIIRAFAGEKLPAPESVAALIVLGAPYGIEDVRKITWLSEEATFLAQLLTKTTAGIAPRILGICFGAQLLAHLLGGSVRPSPLPEIGWHRVDLHFPLSNSALTGLQSPSPTLFQWHGEEVVLPPGAVSLGNSEACANHAFLWENRVLGFAAHPEITHNLCEAFIEACWVEELWQTQSRNGKSTYMQRPEEIRVRAPQFLAENKIFFLTVLDAWFSKEYLTPKNIHP